VWSYGAIQVSRQILARKVLGFKCVRCDPPHFPGNEPGLLVHFFYEIFACYRVRVKHGFYFDDYSNFSTQHALPSGWTPAPTNYPYSFNPHEPYSYCSDPYQSASNCPSWGQFYNFP
jgi:hypothetical protein